MSKLFRSFCLSLLFSASGFSATYYVATTGNNTTGTGAIDNPWATIGKAMTMVVAGDTVYVREGTYREYFSVYDGRAGSEGNYVTISAYNGEEVIVKGSDVVTGWEVHSGNIWKKTSWTTNSQQVFDDGAPLQQIGMPNANLTTTEYVPVGSGLGDMAPGRFWYDSTNSILYVQLSDNSNPNNSVMEVSVRRRIFFAEAARGYIRLVDLIFEHNNCAAYITPSVQDAAVTLSNYSVVDSCTFRNTDFCGLSLGMTTGTMVFDSVFDSNGDLGIQGPGSTNYLISGCTITNNNYRNFSRLWHAGGIKVTTGAYGTIEDNEVADNNGSGIWCDYANSNNTTYICNNYIHDNGPTEAGIFFEASKYGQIHNNVLVGNERRGIYISGSDQAKVYNNTVVGTAGLSAIEVLARNGTSSTNTAVKNNIVFNTVATNDLYMSNGSGNTSDYNDFYRAGSAIRLVNNGTPYTSLLSWQNNTAYDDHSLNFNPMFLSGSGDDYTVSPDSLVVDAGTILNEVADDYDGVERPQGDAYDMGAFERAASGGGGGGTVYASEAFDYSTGAIAGSNGGEGWAAAWTGDNPGASVATPTLSTDDVEGTGNRLFIQAYSNYKTATRDLDATYGTADGVYWFSVLMREDDGYNSGSYAYLQLNGEYNRDPFKIGYNHGGYWYLAPKINTSTYDPVYTDVAVTKGQTVWLVVKITVDSTNGSQAELWIDPDPSSEPTGEADATADLTYTSFGKVVVRSGASYKQSDVSCDEIRLGSSFAAVRP